MLRFYFSIDVVRGRTNIRERQERGKSEYANQTTNETPPPTSPRKQVLTLAQGWSRQSFL